MNFSATFRELFSTEPSVLIHFSCKNQKPCHDPHIRNLPAHQANISNEISMHKLFLNPLRVSLCHPYFSCWFVLHSRHSGGGWHKCLSIFCRLSLLLSFHPLKVYFFLSVLLKCRLRNKVLTTDTHTQSTYTQRQRRTTDLSTHPTKSIG